jgi:hypothetical protein
MIPAGSKMQMTVLELVATRGLIQMKIHVMSDKKVSRKDTCQEKLSCFLLYVEMYVLP